MTASTPLFNSQIVGGIAFDDRTAAVASTVVALCRRYGAEAELVHVVDLLTEPFYGEAAAFKFPEPEVLDQMLIKQIEDAKVRMADLVATLRQSCPTITGKVVTGETVDSLLREVELRKAGLLVAGSAAKIPMLTPAGVAVALSLAQSASVPVLAVSEVGIEASGELRVLLGDDLQPATNAAVRMAFELVTSQPAARVRHLHVAPSAGPFDHDVIVAAMLGRGEVERQQAEASGVVIEREVRRETVGAALHAVIDDADPELLVFGRHRPLHGHPFYIGRLAFRAVVRTRRPVLIVPTDG